MPGWKDGWDVQRVCRLIVALCLALLVLATAHDPTWQLLWLIPGSLSSLALSWWPNSCHRSHRLLIVVAGSVTLGFGLVGGYESRHLYNLLLYLLALISGAALPKRQVAIGALSASVCYVTARYIALIDMGKPYDVTTALTDTAAYLLLAYLVYFLAEGQRQIAHLHRQLLDSARQTETELERTLEASRDIVMVTRFDGEILSISPACAEILGYRPDEMIGRQPRDFIHGDDRAAAITRRARMVSEGGRFHYESRYRHKDGRVVWLEWLARPDERDQVIRSVARDVTERKRKDALLSESEQRYRALFDCNPDVIVVGTLEQGMLGANPAFLEMTGYDPAEMAGMGRMERFNLLFGGLPHEGEKWNRHFAGAAAGQLLSCDLRILHRDGHSVPVEATFIPMVVTGEIRGVYVVAKDITLRREAEAAQYRLAEILEETTDFVTLTAPDGTVLYANKAVRMALATPQAEGLAIADLYTPESLRLVGDVAIPAAIRCGSWSGEAVWRGPNGEAVLVSQVILAHRGPDGDVEYFSTTARDIGERKRFEQELAYLAAHDALTGLLNRRGFQEALSSRLGAGGSGALLYLDIDEFKYVNDSLGHRAGDQLLRNLAELFATKVRPGDVLARLSGDEFVIMLPGTDHQTALTMAEVLLETLRLQTMKTGNESLSITASIGISFYPDHGTGMEDLLAHADHAMYQAKEKGRNIASVYAPDAEYETQIESRMTTERQIRQALEGDGLVLFAQPILDLRLDQVSHYELLLRMRDESGGLVPPVAFLGVAERYGLIHQIDRWVVRQAIHLLARHEQEGRDLFLEVNLSGKALTDPELLSLIRRELAATCIAPHRLVFEITETAAIADFDMAQEFINILKHLGCRFALDDFGAGFSSFDRLKKLPVNYLKLDGSFIKDLPNDEEDRHLVKAMVEVARSLSKQTIAEFVENAETVAILRESGVDYAQGYHVGRPRPVAEIWPLPAHKEATA